MSLYDTPNLTSGIDDALIDVIGEVGVFVPMLLLFVFGIVFIGGMNSQKRRVGYVDTPMWAVLSSLSTLLVALGLSLVSGGIQLQVLAIVVAITVGSGIWFFLDRSRNEI